MIKGDKYVWLSFPHDVIDEIDAQRAEIDSIRGKNPTREEFIAFIVVARAQALKQASIQSRKDLENES